MKGIKTLLTGILAATMIMGSALTVFAAGTEVTINRPDNSGYATGENNTVPAEPGNAQEAIQSYTVYQIFKAKVSTSEDGEKSALYYIENDAAKVAAIEATGLFDLTQNADETWTVVYNGDMDKGAELAEALYEQIDAFGEGTVVEVNGTDPSVTFTLEEEGYYLIVSELGSLLIADTISGDTISIDEKAKYPTIDKEQRDASDNGQWQNEGLDTEDAVEVKVGDLVDYRLTVSIPANASKDIVVTDTMSQGLTINGDIAVAVEGYEYETSAVTDNKFTVTFKVPEDKRGAAATAVITFQASINADALTDTGRKNEVTLDYGNYHQVDFVPYTMLKTAAHKYDMTTKEALEGVEFELLMGETAMYVKAVTVNGATWYVPAKADEQGATQKLYTDADGYIRVTGLDGSEDDAVQKTYKLKETKALDDYNLPEGDNAITQLDTVLDTDATLPAADIIKEIPNGKGTILPSTGGIGTTIFYVVGGLLIVAGVAYFIVRRKADAE